MSKNDQLRAMREAKYARAQTATAPSRPASSAAKAPAAPVRRPAAAPVAPVADEVGPAEPAEELCGHRNMSGRTCTREKGHSAKSHRYS